MKPRNAGGVVTLAVHELILLWKASVGCGWVIVDCSGRKPHKIFIPTVVFTSHRLATQQKVFFGGEKKDGHLATTDKSFWRWPLFLRQIFFCWCAYLSHFDFLGFRTWDLDFDKMTFPFCRFWHAQGSGFPSHVVRGERGQHVENAQFFCCTTNLPPKSIPVSTNPFCLIDGLQ